MPDDKNDDDSYVLEDSGETIEDIEHEMEVAAQEADDTLTHRKTQPGGVSAAIPGDNEDLRKLNDRYLRTVADFENYRRRASREIAAAQERGIAKLAKELLPGVDDLDRALEAAERSAATEGNGAAEDIESQLVAGIKLVHADVIAGLARAGIERFSPHGERFDPQRHEAVAQQPVEGAESGTIVEVYQRGYRLGETVLRPARVVVAQ